MGRFLIVDLETQNHRYFGAVASPRHPENYVVAVGWSLDNGPVQHKYFENKEQAKKFLHIPDSVEVLVAHNAPFEMDWFLYYEYEEIMKFLRRGGRVFCTAYAEYLLSHQQDTYPSLDETAPKYGGTHKVDAVKILWEQGKLTSEIDRTLLLEYLAGPGGDIENTRKTFFGQWALLESRGMLNMALGRMEGMLFNCFAMSAGLHVDRDVAFAELKSQTEALSVLATKFKEYQQHLPQALEFKMTSDYHMSAWLFGGGIKYRERDVWYEEDGVTPKFEKVDCYQFEDGHYIPISVFEDDRNNPVSDPDVIQARRTEAVLLHGPIVRSKAGKNKGMPRVVRVDSTTPKMKWYDRVFQCPALIPMGVLPQDVIDSFKDEFTGKRNLVDGTPVYSTGKECLDKLAVRTEFPENVRKVLADLKEFAKIDKDIGTYYLREELDEEGNVVKQSGMLQYLTPENIVYHVLNCTATVTGRLSSNRPNLQNVPRGDTSNVKKMFTSRFGDDGCIIEADYSALEVVTLAAFSKDSALIKALLEGIDMHCMRLAQQLGEPYEDVLRKCKDEDHPQHKEYKLMRTHIKPKAFAYQYGATAFGIAMATGCTVEDAQAFIDAERALFPEVEAFYEEGVFVQVEKDCSIKREQMEDGQWRVYKTGRYTAPGGTVYEFRQYPKTKYVNGQRLQIMEFKPTQMRNYPIQGESGFFVQIVAGVITRWLISKNFFDGKCFIINQVHDALYFDVHKSVLHEVARTVKLVMEALPEYMKQYGYDLGVPFPAEVEFGPSMFKKEKFNEYA